MSGIVADNVDRASGVVTAAAAGPTISASDPTITTNATLGTQWANSTSGEFYVCTDATADANVWTNVGGGSGDIAPYSFQGANYGFNSGGNPTSSWSSTPTNQISKFSFTSDGNGADVADLTDDRQSTAGCSSETHGYTMSGYHSGYLNVVDKFSFTSGEDATDVGDLSVSRASMAGQSTADYAYASGGDVSGDSDVLDKTSSSSDGNATDVGNLTVGRQYT